MTLHCGFACGELRVARGELRVACIVECGLRVAESVQLACAASLVRVRIPVPQATSKMSCANGSCNQERRVEVMGNVIDS